MTPLPAPGAAAKGAVCQACVREIEAERRSGAAACIVEIGSGRVALVGCRMHRRQARQAIADHAREHPGPPG